MNREYLRLPLFAFLLMFQLSRFISTGQTLMHSYAFETDGVVKDEVGNVDGILRTEDATVSGGDLILSGGYVSLSGNTINLPSYSAIAVEAVFTQNSDIGHTSMLWSFGATYYDGFFPIGVDYLMFMPAYESGAKTQISCLDYINPWLGSEIDGNTISDSKKHHVVSIVTGTKLKMYIDGVLIGSENLSNGHSIANLSNDSALIGASLYPGDPNWYGNIHEFNIYEGDMDSTLVLSRARAFLEGNSASLCELTINGNSITGFSPLISSYDFLNHVDSGLPVVSATAIGRNASVEITQASDIPGTATVNVTATNGEVLAYTIKFEELPFTRNQIVDAGASVTVYPTLSSGKFFVKNNGKESTITVYDLKGNVVFSKTGTSPLETVTINKAGVYIFNITCEGKVYQIKTIKR